ncbi:MAG: hypothetical protein ER33_08060 [Cyanobium sp. CACIAM 14]|nr:MAG: hypothetical protein ER33_08060 [Cyanobium sp. CACIAM 14]
MAHALRPAAIAFGFPLALPALAWAWVGPAGAIPRLDLTPYPQPAAGEIRWVIQLPGVLPPTTDPRLSSSPSDWRVQLIAGREAETDCNQLAFGGRFKAERLAPAGAPFYRVIAVGPLVSTRMACPPGQAKRKVFVPMGSRPFVLPYDASRPIVVVTPKDLQLRWRLWKAERIQQPAQPL